MGAKSRLSKKKLMNLQGGQATGMTTAAAGGREATREAVQQPRRVQKQLLPARATGGPCTLSHLCWLRKSCCKESGAGEEMGAVSAAVLGASATVLVVSCTSSGACCDGLAAPLAARTATMSFRTEFKFEEPCKSLVCHYSISVYICKPISDGANLGRAYLAACARACRMSRKALHYCEHFWDGNHAHPR